MPVFFFHIRSFPLSVGLAAALACALPGFGEEWDTDADLGSFAGSPCADEGLEGVDVLSGFLSRSARVADADCDPEQPAADLQGGLEEALLFQGDPDEDVTAIPETRSTTSFSVSQTSASKARPVRSVLRTRGASNGWEHRFEVRGDSLTRRRLAWSGGAGDQRWNLLGGDLNDAKLPLWPAGIPHRSLPAGWKPAHARAAASAVPQGFAMGVRRPEWSAYAFRVWNPVETGKEPPWRGAWSLRHVAAGAKLAPREFPGSLMLHLSETRITRGTADTLSERLAAVGVSTMRGALSFQAARMESDRAFATVRTGDLYAVRAKHRFGNDATIDFTARQRDGGWSSAWDPAIAADDARVPNADSGAPAWAAGEAHLTGRWPFEDRGFLRGETWRTWNPGAHTERQGERAAFGWRHEDARFELSGARRTTRAASGSIGRAHSIEAETRLEKFPRWRLAAWRAWNRDGPTRSGGYGGAEPEWGGLRLTPGLRVETDADDRLGALATLGLRWRIGRSGDRGGRWNLDASASAPCWPLEAGRFTQDLRWRLTVETTGP